MRPFESLARWRAALDEVLRGPGLGETIVSGHGAVIPRADFEAQARYALDLWDGLARAFRDGRTLEEAGADFSIAARYPGRNTARQSDVLNGCRAGPAPTGTWKSIFNGFVSSTAADGQD